jgi:hypothetical protein
MADPELPGIPPPPEPPRSPWYRRVFTRRKLPAWAVFALLVIEQIPDWKARLDFWLAAAREAGGYAGAAAAMIGSPYFSLGLAVAGVLWLIFVGEPRKGVQRHHWLPYLGWGLFVVCLTAIVLTAGWGAINIYINEQAEKLSGPGWHLTTTQHENFVKAIDAVPMKDRFPVTISDLWASTQSQSMASEIAEIFQSHQWQASVRLDTSLRPDIIGINIVFNPLSLMRKDKDLPFHGEDMAIILQKAGIPFGWGAIPTFDDNSVELAIGSRPPNW